VGRIPAPGGLELFQAGQGSEKEREGGGNLPGVSLVDRTGGRSGEILFETSGYKPGPHPLLRGWKSHNRRREDADTRQELESLTQGKLLEDRFTNLAHYPLPSRGSQKTGERGIGGETRN